MHTIFYFYTLFSTKRIYQHLLQPGRFQRFPPRHSWKRIPWICPKCHTSEVEGSIEKLKKDRYLFKPIPMSDSSAAVVLCFFVFCFSVVGMNGRLVFFVLRVLSHVVPVLLLCVWFFCLPTFWVVRSWCMLVAPALKGGMFRILTQFTLYYNMYIDDIHFFCRPFKMRQLHPRHLNREVVSFRFVLNVQIPFQGVLKRTHPMSHDQNVWTRHGPESSGVSWFYWSITCTCTFNFITITPQTKVMMLV